MNQLDSAANVPLAGSKTKDNLVHLPWYGKLCGCLQGHATHLQGYHLSKQPQHFLIVWEDGKVEKLLGPNFLVFGD